MTLYIVATPIGNLSDITERAVETLNSVDLILAEDTRVTKKLLNRFKINKPVLSYQVHSGPGKIEKIVGELQKGKDIALVTDSGTPGISDPGNELIEKVLDVMGGKIQVVPIPGASALTAAASVSGFPMNRFLFLGFPPKKRKRKKFFKKILETEYSVVLYESPHRIIKTLEEIMELVGEEREVMVGRELTKKFESIYRGPIKKAIEDVKSDRVKGEFTIVIRREE